MSWNLYNFVLQIQIRRFSIAQVGEAENQPPFSDFSPKEYHATEREYRKSIPFYDAALLPILRHNSVLLYTDMSTGATLIAPIFHRSHEAMEARERDSNVGDWLIILKIKCNGNN